MAADSSSNAAWSEMPSSRAPRRLPRVGRRTSGWPVAAASPTVGAALPPARGFHFFARFIKRHHEAHEVSDHLQSSGENHGMLTTPRRFGQRATPARTPSPAAGPATSASARPPVSSKAVAIRLRAGNVCAPAARPGEFAGFGAQAANPAKSPAGLGWGKLRRPLGDGACGARGSTAPHGQCRLAVRRHLDAVRATRRRPRMAPDVDHDGDQARRIWRRHLAVRVDRECCRILYGW